MEFRIHKEDFFKRNKYFSKSNFFKNYYGSDRGYSYRGIW